MFGVICKMVKPKYIWASEDWHSKKSNCPRIDPWGTPSQRWLYLKYNGLRLALFACDSWDMRRTNHYLFHESHNDQAYQVKCRDWRCRKLFLRSMNTPQDSNRWFMFVCISLTMSTIACWVECPLRKPYCDEYKRSCFSM